jgi:hypothetical protein
MGYAQCGMTRIKHMTRRIKEMMGLSAKLIAIAIAIALIAYSLVRHRMSAFLGALDSEPVFDPHRSDDASTAGKAQTWNVPHRCCASIFSNRNADAA